MSSEREVVRLLKPDSQGHMQRIFSAYSFSSGTLEVLALPSFPTLLNDLIASGPLALPAPLDERALFMHWSNVNASVMGHSDPDELAACANITYSHNAPGAPFVTFRVFPALLSDLATKLYPPVESTPAATVAGASPPPDPLALSRQRFMRKNVVPLSNTLLARQTDPASPSSPVSVGSMAAAPSATAAAAAHSTAPSGSSVSNRGGSGTPSRPSAGGGGGASQEGSPPHSPSLTFNALDGGDGEDENAPNATATAAAAASVSVHPQRGYTGVPSRWHLPPSPRAPPRSEVVVGVRPLPPQGLANFLERQSRAEEAKKAKVLGFLQKEVEAEMGLSVGGVALAGDVISRGSRAILERLEAQGVGRHPGVALLHAPTPSSSADVSMAAFEEGGFVPGVGAGGGGGGGGGSTTTGGGGVLPGEALYAAALAQRARAAAAERAVLGVEANARNAKRGAPASEALMRRRLTRECAAAVVYIASRRRSSSSGGGVSASARAGAGGGRGLGGGVGRRVGGVSGWPSQKSSPVSMLWWQLELTPSEMALLAQALGLFGERGHLSPQDAHAAVCAWSGDVRCAPYNSSSSQEGVDGEGEVVGGGGGGGEESGGGGDGGGEREDALSVLGRRDVLTIELARQLSKLWAACSTLGLGEGGWAVLESMNVGGGGGEKERPPNSSSFSSTSSTHTRKEGAEAMFAAMSAATAAHNSLPPLVPTVRILAVLQALITGAYDVRPSVLAAAAGDIGLDSQYITAPPPSLPRVPGGGRGSSDGAGEGEEEEEEEEDGGMRGGPSPALPAEPPIPMSGGGGGAASAAAPSAGMPPSTPSSFHAAIAHALEEANQALRSKLLSSAPPTPTRPSTLAALPPSPAGNSTASAPALHPLAAGVISARATFPSSVLAPLRQLYFNRLAHAHSLKHSDTKWVAATRGGGGNDMEEEDGEAGGGGGGGGGGGPTPFLRAATHARSLSPLSSRVAAALASPLPPSAPHSSANSVADGASPFHPPNLSRPLYPTAPPPPPTSTSAIPQLHGRGRGPPPTTGDSSGECTFVPMLCAKSLAIAEAASARAGTDGMSRVSHLLDYKARSEAHLRGLRLEAEAEKLRECTFKPTILVTRKEGGGEAGGSRSSRSLSPHRGGRGASAPSAPLGITGAAYLPNYSSLLATAAGMGGAAGLGAGAEAAREARRAAALSSAAAASSSSFSGADPAGFYGGGEGGGTSHTLPPGTARFEWLHQLAAIKKQALDDAAKVSERARLAAEESACTFHPSTLGGAGGGMGGKLGHSSRHASSSASTTSAAAAAAAASSNLPPLPVGGLVASIHGTEEHIARAKKAREEREDTKSRMDSLSTGVIQKSALVRDSKGLTVSKPFKLAVELRASALASSTHSSSSSTVPSHSALRGSSSNNSFVVRRGGGDGKMASTATTESIYDPLILPNLSSSSSYSTSSQLHPNHRSVSFASPPQASPSAPPVSSRSRREGGVRVADLAASSTNPAPPQQSAGGGGGGGGGGLEEGLGAKAFALSPLTASPPKAMTATEAGHPYNFPALPSSMVSSAAPSAAPSPPTQPSSSSSFSSLYSSYDPTATVDEVTNPPLLYVDVTVATGNVVRIPVWRESNLELVAVDFAEKQGLPKKMARRLLKLMEEQRNNVLLGGSSVVS